MKIDWLFSCKCVGTQIKIRLKLRKVQTQRKFWPKMTVSCTFMFLGILHRIFVAFNFLIQQFVSGRKEFQNTSQLFGSLAFFLGGLKVMSCFFTRSRARSSSAILSGCSRIVLNSFAKKGIYDIKPMKSIKPGQNRKGHK